MERSGKCMCGAVTFTAKNLPDSFSSCYCKDCQRWVGGAYRGINVATEDLNFLGREHIGTFQSSDFAERANCSKCGSAIWWRLTTTQYFGKTSVSVGLLNDTSGLTESQELFVDYKDQSNETPVDVGQMTSTEAAEIIATFEKDPK